MSVVAAGIYARISQDRQGTMLGVDRQLEDCRRLAAARGWTAAEPYVDDDVSAYTGKARPAYQRLLADLADGKIGAVVAWHADRLHRSPRELEAFIDVVERTRASVATVQSGTRPVHRLWPRCRPDTRCVGAARGRAERGADAAAHQQAAEQGRWRGGTRPFGFAADGVTLDRGEAREVRRLTKAVLEGASLGSLVADLNARGVTTTTGRTWSYATLRQLLRRPRNAGLSEYHGEVIGPATWRPLVDEATWRAVCALLEAPERLRSTSNLTKYLLPGIAVCGAPGCGEPMRSGGLTGRDGTVRRIYRCRRAGVGHAYRDQTALDDYVRLLVTKWLNMAEAAKLLSIPDVNIEELRSEAAQLRGRLAEAAQAFAEGAITAAQLRTASATLRGRLSEVEATLAQAFTGGPVARLLGHNDPGGAFLALPLDQQRAVVRELLEVRVLPLGRGYQREFNPKGVDVTWLPGEVEP